MLKTTNSKENSKINSYRRGQARKEQKNVKIEGPVTTLCIQAANPKMAEVTVANPSPLQEKIY